MVAHSPILLIFDNDVAAPLMNKHSLLTGLALGLTLVAAQSLALAKGVDEPQSGNKLNPQRGKQVYEASCAQCHDTGKNGAPRIRHPDEWNAAAIQSYSVMENHALKGFINMPKKGGRPLLTEQEVADAVFFMQLRIGR